MRITSDGLKPGTQLTIDGDGFDLHNFTIGANGAPQGAIRVFAGGNRPVTLDVAGTAADGSPLAGEVHTGD